MCFILNIAHTHKRSVNKLMAAFKGVFLGLFYKNARLSSLFNIKPCIRFYIESIYIKVVLLYIYVNTLKKYFFVCDERHPFEYALKAHSFEDRF